MSVLNIYIDNFIGVDIDKEGNTIKGITLENVVGQVSKFKEEYDTIKVNLINTPGGDVDHGLQIRDYLLSTGKIIHTHAVGLVASISTIIHATGSLRTQDADAQLMIHNPFFTNVGAAGSEELEYLTKFIKNTENKLAKIYAQVTGQPIDVILNLMKNETYIDAQEAFNLGFTTENKAQELKPVAFFNTNKDSMNEKESLLAKLKELLLPTASVQDDSIKSFDVNTSEGEVISFEREEGEIKVGDKATIDGVEPKNEKSYFIKNGSIEIKFEGGVVSSVIEVEKATIKESELKDMVQSLMEEVVNPLKNELTEAKSKLAVSEETVGQLKAELNSFSGTMKAVGALVGKEVETAKKSVSATKADDKKEDEVLKFELN